MRAYKYQKRRKGKIKMNREMEIGETIETKVKRMVENKEPITDGAPEIFTERKDGVISAYNVRTDKWEIAASAMDSIEASKIAKAEAKAEKAKADKEAKEAKVIDMTKSQSSQGTAETN